MNEFENERYKDGDPAKVTTLWQDYEDGKAYQSQCGMASKLPKFVDFYEGRQWAKETEKTKGFPRPVFNIVEMICRSKKSTLLSIPARIVYKSHNPQVDVDKFNHFADYIQQEMGQDTLDRTAVEDGVKKGTYIYHYYWDAEALGVRGIREGALRCEVIDPLNVFFANPCETDEQKQKWILIASRVDVEAVKAKCDPDVDKDTIVSDEAESKYGTIEQGKDKFCTVLTRYFRKDGEIYCEIATKSAMVRKAFAVTPNMEEARASLRLSDPDAPNNAVPDAPDKDDNLIPEHKKGRRMTYYPIVVGRYKNKEGSIFGISEVEGLIPVQKSINELYGLALLNTESVAGGKYLVHPEALRGQRINNTPAQTIVDYTKTGNGVKRLPDQALPSPSPLADSMITLIRSVAGSTEVMTGELPAANLSGTAINALQAQAQQPIAELRNIFYFVKEKQGHVLAEFFRTYYTERKFYYKDTRPEFDKISGKPIPGTEKEREFETLFSSAEYAEEDFEVVAEATQGTNSSSAGDIAILSELYKAGAIGAAEFVDLYPDDAISSKTELKRRVEEREQSGVQAMQQQVAALTQQLQNAAQVIQQQEKTVAQAQQLINENKSLREMLLHIGTEANTGTRQWMALFWKLYKESEEKINQANMSIAAGNAALQETKADASEFAGELLRQKMAAAIQKR